MKKVIYMIAFFCFLSGAAYSVPHKNNESDTAIMSKSDVEKAVKKKYKGKIISIESKPITGHPNCHIVKMKTPSGGIRYIRYACK